jgi:hypothetical protein
MKSIRWLLKEAQEDAEKTWPGCLVSVHLMLWRDGTPRFNMVVQRNAEEPDLVRSIYGGPCSDSPTAAILATRGDSVYALVKRMEQDKRKAM